MPFIQTLANQPTDIIGDIHGEYEALEALLKILGYSENGHHPQGRKLVFCGDLVDRGPDSPAVMEKVIRLVEAGVAQCILGNHELNILRGVSKGGNGWLLGNDPAHEASAGHQPATAQQRQEFIQFLEQQPLVLEGPHLRIVHACWNSEAIESLLHLQNSNSTIKQLYGQIEQDIIDELEAHPEVELKKFEMASYAAQVLDPDWEAQLIPSYAEEGMALQMKNPFRVLTTSEEKITQTPFWAGGKWRMTERLRWWDNYEDGVPVVIGHFWRLFNNDARRITGMFGPDVFEGISSHDWLGKHLNVYCVDYSVGQRHLERRHQKRRQKDQEDFHGKLAALRYPEWEVIQDDGDVIEIGPPGP
jgi:hypothetical protein